MTRRQEYKERQRQGRPLQGWRVPGQPLVVAKQKGEVGAVPIKLRVGQ